MDASTDTPTAATEAKPRKHWSYSQEDRTLTAKIDGAVVGTYPLNELPALSLDYLLAAGAKFELGRADDPDATFAKLMAGDFAKSGKRAVKMDAWRMAVAQAMVDLRKKSSDPLTIDGAKDLAANFSKEEMAEFRRDAAVVKAWHKINGTTPVTLASKLAA